MRNWTLTCSKLNDLNDWHVRCISVVQDVIGHFLLLFIYLQRYDMQFVVTIDIDTQSNFLYWIRISLTHSLWLQKRKSHKQIGSAKNAVRWLLSSLCKYSSIPYILFVKCTPTFYAHFFVKTQYKGITFIKNNLQCNIQILLHFIQLLWHWFIPSINVIY